MANANAWSAISGLTSPFGPSIAMTESNAVTVGFGKAGCGEGESAGDGAGGGVAAGLPNTLQASAARARAKKGRRMRRWRMATRWLLMHDYGMARHRAMNHEARYRLTRKDTKAAMTMVMIPIIG